MDASATAIQAINAPRTSTATVPTTAALDELSASIWRVSQHAGQAAALVQQAQTSARNGMAALRAPAEPTARNRERFQVAARRIKRLGECSQEIDQHLQRIDDFADRTSLLALNAAIRA